MIEYIHDGTFEGLLTAVYHAFRHGGDCTISRAGAHAPNLLDEPVTVEPSEELFDRVYRGIKRRMGFETLKNVYYLHLSEARGVDALILEYLRLAAKRGPRVNLAKNQDTILKVDRYVRQVGHEAHRFTGFLRFTRVAPRQFYAAIEPDHNILPLIAGHFTRRFSDQCFIIHDLKRESAALYNLNEVVMAGMTREQGDRLQQHTCDESFDRLWREFYQAVNIEERRNESLRRQLLPRRYWKHLTELME
ncbi:MAG: DNA metabolism protein [Firmicutes bacterium]|nr:DNA metabolism protein [Bacillota bacterium]